jgi:hypothetical protein
VHRKPSTWQWRRAERKRVARSKTGFSPFDITSLEPFASSKQYGKSSTEKQTYISEQNEELNPALRSRPVVIFHKEKHPMRKTLAIALMLTASLGLAACDKNPRTKLKMPTTC